MFKSLTRGIKVSGLLPAVLLGASFALATLPAAAQEQMPTPTPVSEPLYKEYKGVSLGMSVEEARRALGEPKSKGTRQDFFVFSEKEMAQVFYRAGKVSALSVNYIGEESGAPEAMAVLGVEIKPKKDGSLYRIVRYPKAGYWVSFSQTAGKNPITTVTMRRSQAKRR